MTHARTHARTAHQARLLRYHIPTAKLSVLGAWPRSPLVDRVTLSTAPGGRLLLTGSSTALARVVGVVLEPSGKPVSVVADFEHAGVLALDPTLTERALSLPLASPSPPGVANVVLRADQLLSGAFDLHPKGKGKGAGKPVSIADVL